MDEKNSDRDTPSCRVSHSWSFFRLCHDATHRLPPDVSLIRVETGVASLLADLSLPYRVITLNRLSLFDTNRLVLPNLSHPRLQLYADCLASGENTCTQSARAILISIDTSKRTCQQWNYWTLNSVTAAVFALYIHTWKNASTWQAQSDLQVCSQ